MNHSHHKGGQMIATPKYEEIPVLDTNFEVIFPTFFASFKLDIDNDKILQECYELRKQDPKGVRKSNIGGWQSEIYALFDIRKDLTPNIQTLAFNTILAANDVSEEHNLNMVFPENGCQWWININDEVCYNAVHSHPGSQIIALYYPKVSYNGDQGNLSIIRQDGSQHCGLYEHRMDYTQYDLNAEVGTLYLLPSHVLHFVTPNRTDAERVSIAFNLSSEQYCQV